MAPGPRLAILGLLASMLSASTPQAAVVLDRAAAVNAVVAQLAPAGNTAVWCPYVDYGFGHRGLLPAGTVVRPQRGGFPHVGNAVTLTCPMYAFFVDPEPSGIYAHPVQYVFVDATVANPSLLDGTIHVEPQEWWPVVRRFQVEESFFGPNGRNSELPAAVTNPDGLVFDADPPGSPAEFPEGDIAALLPVAENLSEACAIVITGDRKEEGPAERGLWRSAEEFKAAMQARGMPQGRIFTKYNAHKDDIRDVIKRTCATSVNPPCKKFFVYVGAHGKPDSLWLKNDTPVNADTLCSIFKKLGDKGKPVCLLIESCYGGSLIDDLRPKLPLGVIITATDSLHMGGAGSSGAQNDFPGSYWHAFRRCWDDAAADTAGDKDGTVEWHEAYYWVQRPGNGIVDPPNDPPWDVNGVGPQIAGLPDKKERKNKPGVGWITVDKRDYNNDGAYDYCRWRLDKDCDGTDEVDTQELVYTNGQNRRVAQVYRDADDDGVKENRYDIVDRNNDGEPDSLYCLNWNGSGYTLNASIGPRSTDSFSISPNAGTEHGGQAFTITAGATFWSGPVQVFIGSEVENAVWLGPTQLQGTTTGFLPGPCDVIVADFNPFSASYGFDVLNDGYTYTPEMAVEGVDPDHAFCGQIGVAVTVSGRGFDPGAMVRFDGIVLPTTWVNAETLTASVPPCVAPAPVSVSVENPDLESASRDSAFTFRPDPDTMPPVITCPPELYLAPGPDGLARTPTEWEAEATDESGQVSVARSTLGALAGGTHQIRFDAVDGAGNRSLCTALVHVSGSSTVPTPHPTVFAAASPHPNPFTAASTMRVALPEAAPVRLRVFSLTGRLVATIVDRDHEPGEYDFTWNGHDAAGPAASGVYFLNLEAGPFRATRRVTLVR